MKRIIVAAAVTSGLTCLSALNVSMAFARQAAFPAAPQIVVPRVGAIPAGIPGAESGRSSLIPRGVLSATLLPPMSAGVAAQSHPAFPVAPARAAIPILAPASAVHGRPSLPAASAQSSGVGALDAVREVAADLSAAAGPEAPVRAGAILEKFYGGIKAGDDDSAVVELKVAWTPETNSASRLTDFRAGPSLARVEEVLGLPRLRTHRSGRGPVADLFRLLAFALDDETSMAKLANKRRAHAPQMAAELIAAYEKNSGKMLSTGRREALLRRLTAPGTENKSPLSLLARRAERLLTARELMSTLSQAHRLHARFFPAFYRALPMRMSFRSQTNVGGEFRIPASIILSANDFPIPGIEPVRTFNFFRREADMAPRTMRLVIVFHEYAHALFFERVGIAPDEAVRPFDAVNEGFAVMLELLMIDKAVAAREELGLSDLEVQDLLEWKRGRLLRSLRSRNHYTEGTLRFWHQIFKSGGEEAMLRMLDSLAAERLMGIPLAHPVFILAGGRPELAAAFTRGNPFWNDWLALANHIADGAPLPDSRREAALAALSLVRPAALQRFFESVLNTRNPAVFYTGYKSPDGIFQLLRLARLSPPIATRLAAFLSRRLPAIRPSLILFRGLSWMDALTETMASLPLTGGMSASLTSLVRSWIAASFITGEDSVQAQRAAATGLARLAARAPSPPGQGAGL